MFANLASFLKPAPDAPAPDAHLPLMPALSAPIKDVRRAILECEDAFPSDDLTFNAIERRRKQLTRHRTRLKKLEDAQAAQEVEVKKYCEDQEAMRSKRKIDLARLRRDMGNNARLASADSIVRACRERVDVYCKAQEQQRLTVEMYEDGSVFEPDHDLPVSKKRSADDDVDVEFARRLCDIDPDFDLTEALAAIPHLKALKRRKL